MAVTFGAFVAGYIASVAPLPWLATSALLFTLFALAWWASSRSAVGLGVAAVAALGGPLVESLLVGRGAFVHHQVLAFGVPGWLPFLYLLAAVALTTTASWLVDGGGRHPAPEANRTSSVRVSTRPVSDGAP